MNVMNVKNRKLIRALTLRTIKAGKVRNIVAVIAIALTATMFTTVFSIGGNMLVSMQNATMRQVGTSSHGGLKYLSQEQYDNFKESPLIKDISYNIMIAGAENEALRKKQTEIRYSEDDCAKWGFSYPTTGDMPRAGKELACSTITLDMLGIPHELGQTVPLEFTVRGKKIIEEFTLVGFWQGDDVMAATQVYLSREYTDSIIDVPENPSWDMGMDGVFGSINADVWFSNSFDIEGKMDALVTERGYTLGEIYIGVNWAYAGSETIEPTTATLVVFIVLLILFSGYLIIYSIFTISVSGDIRFYGLLKTIGATGKQLRRIVRGQALLLSLIGIPLGFVMGYALGYGLSPFLMSITSYEGGVTATANPLIFLFAGVFSLITVFISCRKPGRIASRVSPVEAVRYTEAASGGKKEKNARKVTPVSMAWANIMRNKRKLIVVTLSLSLSMIMLNSAYSIVRGFDMEEYLKFMIVSDFSVAELSVYSAMSSYKDFEGVDSEVLNGIDNLDGIEEKADIYFYDDYEHRLSPQGHKNFNAIMDFLKPTIEKEMQHAVEQIEGYKTSGVVPMHIYGTGEMAVRKMSEQPIDYAKLASGKYVLATHVIEGDNGGLPAVYDAGDKISLVNKEGEAREFEVLAVVSYPHSISCQHGHYAESTIVMADNVYLDFYGDKQPMMTIFNVADEQIPAAEEWLSNYCESVNSSLDYRSRSFYKDEFENTQRTFMMMGGALAFILALIGILNFINSVVTSIAARRRELAMLQSVGMTGRQLKTMLFGEGSAYAILTALFSITAGTLLGRLVIQVMAGDIWFFKWNFTITPLLITMPLLFAICALIPIVCYRFMRRESVVERLRVE